MPIIEWNPSMSVGVKMIDEEHMRLIEIVNELSDALEEGKALVVLEGLLEAVVSFASYHFQHEESLFLRTAYPDAIHHIREHERLKSNIKDIQKRYRQAPSPEILTEVFVFTKDLFMNHALGIDVGYAKYLREAGFN